jgi:hypothetical protein
MAAFRLDLDWEERLFTGLRSLLRRARGDAPKTGASQALPLERPLQLLAGMLAGRTVELVPATSRGGIREDSILFPLEEHPIEADPEELRLLRLVMSSLMLRVNHEQHEQQPDLLRASLHAALTARRMLEVELPAFAARLELLLPQLIAGRPAFDSLPEAQSRLELIRQGILRGELDAVPADMKLDCDTAPDQPISPPLPWGEFLALPQSGSGAGIDPDFQKPETPDGTEVEGLCSEDPEFVTLSKQELEQQCLIHVFEKVETADDYSGGSRQLDGEDELEEQLEAIRELAMKHMVRGGNDTHAIYRASMRMDAEIPDLESCDTTGGIVYPEWDQRRTRYREAWCRVHPASFPDGAPEWVRDQQQRHARSIRQLEQRLKRFRQSRLPQRGLEDGPELDVDAAIRAEVDRRVSGNAASRIHEDRLPNNADLAISILMDSSLSTDGWAEDQRILDLSRESVFVLGEVLNRLAMPFSLQAFASKTRNRCRVWGLKEFRESWTRSRIRLGALEPIGYTRIGPALRHTMAGLRHQPQRKKLLLLLSDGKPNDYDRYEGRHGIADIRRAVREGQEAGIHVHALAIGSESRTWLPEMMGHGHWHVLNRPRDLLAGLTDLTARLAYG